MNDDQLADDIEVLSKLALTPEDEVLKRHIEAGAVDPDCDYCKKNLDPDARRYGQRAVRAKPSADGDVSLGVPTALHLRCVLLVLALLQCLPTSERTRDEPDVGLHLRGVRADVAGRVPRGRGRRDVPVLRQRGHRRRSRRSFGRGAVVVMIDAIGGDIVDGSRVIESTEDIVRLEDGRVVPQVDLEFLAGNERHGARFAIASTREDRA